MNLIKTAAYFGKDPSWEPLHHMLMAMAQSVDQARPATGSKQFSNGGKTICGGTHGNINGVPHFHQFLEDLGYELYYANNASLTVGDSTYCGGFTQPSAGGPSNRYYGGSSHRMATWGYSCWARALMKLPISPSIISQLSYIGYRPGFEHGAAHSDDGGPNTMSNFYAHISGHGPIAMWALFPEESDPYNVRSSRLMKNHHKGWYFKHWRSNSAFQGTSVTYAGNTGFENAAFQGWVPAPENISAANTGVGTARITWNAVAASVATDSPAATSYNVYRSPVNPNVVNSTWEGSYTNPKYGQAITFTSDKMTKIATVTGTSYDDSTSPGFYFYAVSANSSTGGGCQSDQAGVTI
jgi:hypothetical protein